MADTLHTRPADPGDGPRLYRLDHDSWSTVSEVSERSAPPGPDSTLFDEDRHRMQDYLVAELDGQVVGYVRLVPPTQLPSNAHIRQISGLAVDPSARRRGVGAALVAAAVEQARRVGARRVTLRVLGHNTAARRLYQAAGFTVEGTVPEEFCLDGRYADDVLMGLTLRADPLS